MRIALALAVVVAGCTAEPPSVQHMSAQISFDNAPAVTPAATLVLDGCARVDGDTLQYCDCTNADVDAKGAALPVVDVAYTGTGNFAEEGSDVPVHARSGHAVYPVKDGAAVVLAAYRDGPLYSLDGDGVATALGDGGVVVDDDGTGVTAQYDIGDVNDAGTDVVVHEVHAPQRGAAKVDRQDASSLICSVGGCAAAGAPAPLAVLALAIAAGRIRRRRR